jgi:hypothetical protein
MNTRVYLRSEVERGWRALFEDDAWLARTRNRVSRVETMVGYSLWHCVVGRRKTGHVVGMCCSVL